MATTTKLKSRRRSAQRNEDAPSQAVDGTASTITTSTSSSASKSKKTNTTSTTTTKMRTPKTISDFHILPLTLAPLAGLPAKYASPTHYLYIKPHAPAHPTPEDEKSLFLVNLPIDASESNLKALFASEALGSARALSVDFDERSGVPGEVRSKKFKTSSTPAANTADEAGLTKASKKRKRDEQIVAEGVVEDEESRLPATWAGDLRRSGATAVVRFVDRRSFLGAWEGVRRAVKLGTVVRWLGESGEGVVGVDRYTHHLRTTYPAPHILSASITAYLQSHDTLQSSRSRLQRSARSLPDAEGFTTVSRGAGGRAAPARIEDAARKKAELDERRKKAGAGDGFYRFQNRERAKERVGELRRRFEGDRRRVEEMRERRGGR